MRVKIVNNLLLILTYVATIVTFGTLFFLLVYILVKGVPELSSDLFAFQYTTENVSLFPSLITTVIMVVLSLIIVVPIGIFTAIFLVEYSRRGSKIVKIIRIAAETLSGIPSIVYGLFGLLFFVTWIGWGFSLIAGVCTLSIMILPLIMRTAEESLISVPDTYREASFGLGAGHLRTVFRVVLPSAVPGILAGVILGIGRIVGETAALIYTAGTVTQIPSNLLASGRTLSVHLYALSSEGLHTGKAYATAVVLLVLVVGINALSAAVAKKVGGSSK